MNPDGLLSGLRSFPLLMDCEEKLFFLSWSCTMGYLTMGKLSRNFAGSMM